MVGGELKAHHVDNTNAGFLHIKGLCIALFKIIGELGQKLGMSRLTRSFKPSRDYTVFRST